MGSAGSVSKATTTVRVYRLEDANGEGPYNSNLLDPDYRLQMSGSHSFDSTHPTSSAEGFGFPYVHEYFAFLSMTDLFRWFGGYLKPLMERGVSIGVYEVDSSEVRIGTRQVLFNKTLSIKVK